MVDREHLPIIQAFIDQLAQRADAFAAQAGVGAHRAAGQDWALPGRNRRPTSHTPATAPQPSRIA